MRDSLIEGIYWLTKGALLIEHSMEKKIFTETQSTNSNYYLQLVIVNLEKDQNLISVFY